MDLTPETYSQIVSYVDKRADIATLCRVSKSFQSIAERALYTTLYLEDPRLAVSVFTALAGQSRVAELVHSLTVHLSEDQDTTEGGDTSEETGGSVSRSRELPEEFWTTIAKALEKTTRLRYLDILINDAEGRAGAWVLGNCTFRLKRFHCDLDWDRHLVAFLNNQAEIDDLYIMDFKEPGSGRTPTPAAAAAAAAAGSGSSQMEADESPPLSFSDMVLDDVALPKLERLECTFSEAAMAIVPGRPITHLKTCFSRSAIREKRAELVELLLKVNLSTRPLRSLDIADATYSEAFSMELMEQVVKTCGNVTQLGYLGTLVLPVPGEERLKFYALLMRLPRVQCIEIEVSEWSPPLASPPAFRALVKEIRLYCPTIARVVFVDEFERTAVSFIDGKLRVDSGLNFESLWRDA